LGYRALRERVAALRCGLDSSYWRIGEKSREACKILLGSEVTQEQAPPFDAAAAHALYRDLFGGIEDLTQGKRLLIVPSGALTRLPFEVLVTAKHNETLPRFEAYKTVAWLGQRQAITILPSVGSLKASRVAKASAAAEPFAGFGNPLLTGLDGTDKRAWAKQECGEPAPKLEASIASPVRDGAVNVEDLRRQPPLPETADELCTVGRELGVPEAGLRNAIHLGKGATVSKVKALSRSGDLARVRVVHFATHGLLAGETAMFAKNKAEPALLLTPPAEASEEDNGLLTASEVAQLNLNADWVVMSACNTAAGSAEGAEALSGLARAFFYAGARALLVSHWYVDSEAAVAITTGAVNAMKANPKIGRAEALRAAQAALIAKGGRFAHPSVWAPFVLVGNGEQPIPD
jgi:CHAT domain-containing protein